MSNKVTVSDVVKKLKLEVMAGEKYLDKEVTRSTSSRPGVEIYSDYFDFYESNRIQVIGSKELNLFYMLNSDQQDKRIDRMFSYLPPAFIFTGNISVVPQVFYLKSEKYHIPLLKTKLRTSPLIGALGNFLSIALAPKKTIHGVMIDIDGVGVLMKGKSFIGKSETALELVKRGHTLVSDDAVELVVKENREIIASAPDLTERLMEIRGLGIIDVVDLFGVKAFRKEKRVMLVVELLRSTEDAVMPRLGSDNEQEMLLDVALPKVKIYVMPGRNIATLVEVAAMNWKLKSFGINREKELIKRLDDKLKEK